MHHDLKKGLIYLDEDELRSLGEIRSPVDERVVPYMLRAANHAIKGFNFSIDYARALCEAEIPTSVPSDVAIERLQACLQRVEALLPELEKVALDVEFKWRESSFDGDSSFPPTHE